MTLGKLIPLLMCLCSAASAARFNFETAPDPFSPPPLVVNDSGLMISVATAQVPNGFIEVRSAMALLPVEPGGRSTWQDQVNISVSGLAAPVRFTFSAQVPAITFLVTAGGAANTNVKLTAFDERGFQLGSINGFTASVLTNTFANASYFELSSPVPAPQANQSVLFVPESFQSSEIVSNPEPGTISVALGLGLMGLWARRRKTQRNRD
ncbi:MAG: PEP-CTERM sorting domain-containing protein [Acidobacteriota bacterium]